MCLGVGLAVLEEDTELTVQAALNILAITEELAGLGSKFVLLVLGIDMAF
jgi:hypothetical protein